MHPIIRRLIALIHSPFRRGQTSRPDDQMSATAQSTTLLDERATEVSVRVRQDHGSFSVKLDAVLIADDAITARLTVGQRGSVPVVCVGARLEDNRGKEFELQGIMFGTIGEDEYLGECMFRPGLPGQSRWLRFVFLFGHIDPGHGPMRDPDLGPAVFVVGV